jgi:hypothetical protein
MFRLVSVLGMAALTVAAVALVTSPRSTRVLPRPDKGLGKDAYRPARSARMASVFFHASFSLN